jgi:[histone H3]-N6,N6-dimethyl-lysine9 N-methyltransferase
VAQKYVAHICSPACLKKPPNLAAYSPLTKPLLTCWERQIVKQKTNKWIVYKAPCGRRLRNMYEIRHYLMITKSPLNVDNFDFDINMQVLAAYDVADKTRCPLYIPDLSEGKEGMKIPVVNAFDDTAPPKLEYSASRIPMKNVNINTDPEFMACCDCTDDCADKTKCACFQQTIRGFKFAMRDETKPDDDIGYIWKRLLEQVTTGIYECHSRCKCTSRCLNKVVQAPIQIKMQLYRTKNRGWGLESCHDIPKGTFICIYAGRLYTEDDANAICQGLDHGDEYFAELDLIETSTALKENYEAGVINPDSESDEDNSDSDYDEKDEEGDGDFMSTAKAKGDREIVTRSARGSRTSERTQASEKSKNDSDDSEDDIVNIQPSLGNASGGNMKIRSFRKLYGKNEKVYIMDAKTCGNVGRYFNVSFFSIFHEFL